jgi:hypothetical protein
MKSQNKELTDHDIQFFLHLFASSGNCKKTKEFLEKYADRINAADDLGADGDEGTLFGFGFLKSPELLKILIDNYVEMVIEKQETDQGRKVKTRLLSEMLERQLYETVEYDKLSEEYKEILAPWLPKDEDSESEQDLEGFEGIGDDIAEGLLPEFNTLNAASEYESPFVDTPKELIGEA